MGTYILYHAEQRSAGKWRVLKDADGKTDFFYFGGSKDRRFWDLLFGEIGPNTGLTSYGYIPIAEPRGVPEDYPPRKDYAEYGYSWVLLQELVDYPWEQRQRHVRAFVDAANFRAYLDGADFRFFPVTPPHLNSPVRFPKPEWTIVSHEQMLNLVFSSKSNANFYTEVEFTRPYDVSPYAQWILTDTIPKLRAFGDPRDIRIVFSFIC